MSYRIEGKFEDAGEVVLGLCTLKITSDCDSSISAFALVEGV